MARPPRLLADDFPWLVHRLLHVTADRLRSWTWWSSHEDSGFSFVTLALTEWPNNASAIEVVFEASGFEIVDRMTNLPY